MAARVVIGGLMALALLAIFVVATMDAADAYRSGASVAAQTDISASGTFWAVTVIGLGLAAHIATGGRRDRG